MFAVTYIQEQGDRTINMSSNKGLRDYDWIFCKSIISLCILMESII